MSVALKVCAPTPVTPSKPIRNSRFLSLFTNTLLFKRICSVYLFGKVCILKAPLPRLAFAFAFFITLPCLRGVPK
jgi:hypothetical protein